MGILDNIKKLNDYKQYRDKERILNKRVAEATTQDTTFYAEYSTFAKGLREKLVYILFELDYREVKFTPTNPSNVKYFRQAMKDKEFSTNYHINVTASGEFIFRAITLQELKEKTDKAD